VFKAREHIQLQITSYFELTKFQLTRF